MENSINYKASKEAFVSDMTGSTISHVNLISAVALSSIALHSCFCTYLSVPKSFELLIEWSLLVLPLLLSMTLFADAPAILSLLLVVLAGCITLIPQKKSNTSLFPSQVEIPRAPSPSHAINIASGADPPALTPTSGTRIHISPLPSLTIYRSHMMLMTILAILAVDFPIFPRSLAKCETFGVSLMDLGVGSFVFSQGVVSAIPVLKDPSYVTASSIPKLITAVKKVLPLLFLGIVRIISIKGTEYPEHESEYGTHWNFFLTMAILPVLEVALHPLIVYLPISFLGFMVAIAHQMALSFTPLQHYTLNAARTGIISANKEGLVSLTGYLAIHLLGLSAGTVLLPPSPSDFRRQQHRLRKAFKYNQTPSNPVDGSDRPYTKQLQRQDAKTAIELFSYAVLWWGCLGACYALGIGEWVSRRLANLPYVVWISAFNTSFILCYLLLDMVHFPPSKAKLEHPINVTKGTKHIVKKPPKLLEAFNINGLTIFLLANVATGLINLSIQTMYVSDVPAFLILSVYSFGLSALAWICRGVRILKI